MAKWMQGHVERHTENDAADTFHAFFFLSTNIVRLLWGFSGSCFLRYLKIPLFQQSPTPTPSTPFLWADQNPHSARYVSLRLGFPNRKNPKPLYYQWSSHTASTGEFADLKHVILAHDANKLRAKQVDVTERRGKLGALLEHHVHSENKGRKKTVKTPSISH